MKQILAPALCIAATAIFTSSCSKQSSDPKSDTRSQPEQTATTSASASVDTVMAPYEDCRKLLAADKSEGIPECASAMAKAAGSLLEEAGAHRKHVAVAATALAEILSLIHI